MTTYRRAPGVLERRSLRALVLLPPEGALVVLEGTGPAVWAALDQPRAFEELVTELADAFESDRDVVARDLDAALAELLAARVLLKG